MGLTALISGVLQAHLHKQAKRRPPPATPTASLLIFTPAIKQRKSAKYPSLRKNPRTNKAALDTHRVDNPSLM